MLCSSLFVDFYLVFRIDQMILSFLQYALVLIYQFYKYEFSMSSKFLNIIYVRIVLYQYMGQ